MCSSCGMESWVGTRPIWLELSEVDPMPAASALHSTSGTIAEPEPCQQRNLRQLAAESLVRPLRPLPQPYLHFGATLLPNFKRPKTIGMLGAASECNKQGQVRHIHHLHPWTVKLEGTREQGIREGWQWTMFSLRHTSRAALLTFWTHVLRFLPNFKARNPSLATPMRMSSLTAARNTVDICSQKASRSRRGAVEMGA